MESRGDLFPSLRDYNHMFWDLFDESNYYIAIFKPTQSLILVVGKAKEINYHWKDYVTFVNYITDEQRWTQTTDQADISDIREIINYRTTINQVKEVCRDYLP